MKTLNISLIGLLMAGLVLAAGCGDDGETVGPQDGGPNTGDSTDSIIVDKSMCGTIGTTCKANIEGGTPDNCIADFSWGSNQVGKDPGTGFDQGTTVGFYGYNDKTPGATMDPVPNNDGAEPAATIDTCTDKTAMRLMVDGWADWGAGVGMDWGGPKNPNCDEAAHPGVTPCMTIGVDDNKFVLAATLALPVCQGPTPEETAAFVDCLKYGKVYKEMRDLSAYKGIGFWLLAGSDNAAANLKVTFPIPETARFLWERQSTSAADGCDEDNDSKKCFNDFATNVQIDTTPNKWFWHEVLFERLKWSDQWGYELTQHTTFPKERSIGIKFQIDKTGATTPHADLYIDDIVLLPM